MSTPSDMTNTNENTSFDNEFEAIKYLSTLPTETAERHIKALSTEKIYQLWSATKILVTQQCKITKTQAPTFTTKQLYKPSSKNMYAKQVSASELYCNDITGSMTNINFQLLEQHNITVEALKAHYKELPCKASYSKGSTNKAPLTKTISNKISNFLGKNEDTSKDDDDKISVKSEPENGNNDNTDVLKAIHDVGKKLSSKIDTSEKRVTDTLRKEIDNKLDIFKNQIIENVDKKIKNQDGKISKIKDEFTNKLMEHVSRLEKLISSKSSNENSEKPAKRRKNFLVGKKSNNLVIPHKSILAFKVPNQEQYNEKWIENTTNIPDAKIINIEHMAPQKYTDTIWPRKSYKVTFESTKLRVSDFFNPELAEHYPQGAMISQFWITRKRKRSDAGKTDKENNSDPNGNSEPQSSTKTKPTLTPKPILKSNKDEVQPAHFSFGANDIREGSQGMNTTLNYNGLHSKVMFGDMRTEYNDPSYSRT